MIKYLVICSFVFCSQAIAGGYKLIDQDAKATARGNAFVATADSPSAVHYNPAGLTQLEGSQYQLGYFATSLDVDYTSTDGMSSSTKNQVKGPPQLYISSKLSDSRWSFGLGLNSPYGLGLEWPKDTGFQTVVTESELLYLSLSPVLAFEVNDKLSIGFGPVLNYGDLTFRQSLTPQGSNDIFSVELDGWSSGYRLGALWKLSEKHSFGFSFHSNSYLRFKGDTMIDGLPKTRTNLSLPFPESITVGYSFRLDDSWNFETNVDWTNWERLNQANLNNTPFGNMGLPFNWDSTFAYSLGLTKKLKDDYIASIGYLFSENAQPDRYFTPLVPDTDKNFFSLGLGRTTSRIDWFVAYQLLIADDRRIVGAPLSAQSQSVDGSYEFSQHSLTFSVGSNF